MKTTMISLVSATLFALTAHAGGHSLEATDLLAVVFASGLVAWTSAQYNR